MLIAIFVLLSIVGIVVFMYHTVGTKNFKSLNIPIHTGLYSKLPIIGKYFNFGPNFNEFQHLVKIGEFKCGRMYGLLFGKQLEIVSSEPELIEEILRSEKHQNNGLVFKYANSILDLGIAVSTGTEFEKQRNVLTSVFNLDFLKQVIPTIERSGDELVDTFMKIRGYENVLPAIKMNASSLILETLACTCLKKPQKLTKLLDESFMIDMNRTFSHWKRCSFVYNLSPSFKRQNEIKEAINKIMKETIEKHKRIVDTNQSYPSSVLDYLIRAEADGEINDVKNNLLALIIISNETLSSLIAFALYELADKSNIQEKLLEEIQTVLGDEKTSAITYEQINDMKYLNFIFNETLRLYNTNSYIEKTIVEDIKYKNVTFPKGSSFLICVNSLHQDSVYNNGLVFIPERFLPKYLEQRHPYSFIPFGKGFKSYLGHSLIALEFKITLIKLVKHFKISKMSSFVAKFEYSNNVLQNINGIEVKLEERTNTSS